MSGFKYYLYQIGNWVGSALRTTYSIFITTDLEVDLLFDAMLKILSPLSLTLVTDVWVRVNSANALLHSASGEIGDVVKLPK
ncbi:hypothetical protein ACTXT7_006975 [Hymenolepis weldensis]